MLSVSTDKLLLFNINNQEFVFNLSTIYQYSIWYGIYSLAK